MAIVETLHTLKKLDLAKSLTLTIAGVYAKGRASIVIDGRVQVTLEFRNVTPVAKKKTAAVEGGTKKNVAKKDEPSDPQSAIRSAPSFPASSMQRLPRIGMRMTSLFTNGGHLAVN